MNPRVLENLRKVEIFAGLSDDELMDAGCGSVQSDPHACEPDGFQ
jgi:hypothetical protein